MVAAFLTLCLTLAGVYLCYGYFVVRADCLETVERTRQMVDHGPPLSPDARRAAVAEADRAYWTAERWPLWALQRHRARRAARRDLGAWVTANRRQSLLEELEHLDGRLRREFTHREK